MKGWLAFDIDGTLTADKYTIPYEVANYLHSLQQSGWNCVLLTGRSFSFAKAAASCLPFPYYFVLQNGSLTLQMPGKTIVEKRYMPSRVIPILEDAVADLQTDFLVYAGFEKGDFCYYRPHLFSRDDLHYIQKVKDREKEEWKTCEAFDLKEIGHTPLIKGLGSYEKMKKLAKRLEHEKDFTLSLIRDPFVADYYVLMINDKGASKGHALQDLLQKYPGGKVICAGDDENDLSMFACADIKIAMENAPPHVLAKADIIAPSAHSMGIIAALKKALA